MDVEIPLTLSVVTKDHKSALTLSGLVQSMPSPPDDKLIKDAYS